MTTAVGLRCRDCAQVRPPVTYQTDSGIVARALGAGLVAAVVIGAAWGVLMEAGLGPRTPYDWSFWFALLLGFGVAECVSLAANRKRGSTLQAIGIGCVLLGFIVSRVVYNLRLPRPVPLDVFWSQPVDVAQYLRVDLLALIFLALACAIAYVRFR
jgi:hypothetical protein